LLVPQAAAVSISMKEPHTRVNFDFISLIATV
jgi:hypothetical protein